MLNLLEFQKYSVELSKIHSSSMDSLFKEVLKDQSLVLIHLKLQSTMLLLIHKIKIQKEPSLLRTQQNYLTTQRVKKILPKKLLKVSLKLVLILLLLVVAFPRLCYTSLRSIRSWSSKLLLSLN
jgi:hypothetical protein